MKARARKWTYHHPRTSTQPITIAQYRAGLETELMVKHATLTDEYKAWGWKQVQKHIHNNKEGQ